MCLICNGQEVSLSKTASTSVTLCSGHSERSEFPLNPGDGAELMSLGRSLSFSLEYSSFKIKFKCKKLL